MRLQTKLLALLVPLGAASAGVVLFLSGQGVGAILVESVAERAYAELAEAGAKAAYGLERGSERDVLPQLNESMARTHAAYAMALDVSGRVVAHTNVLETGKTLLDPATTAALARREPGFIVLDGPGGRLLDASVPVWSPDEDFLLAQERDGRTMVGVLRIGIPLGEADATRSRIRFRLASLILLAGGASALLLGAALRRLLAPIRELSASIELIGRGRYGVTVPVRSSDELGELAAGVNAMSSELSRTSVSRDFLDGVFRGIADAVFVTDPAGVVEMVNPAGLALLGRAEPEVLGRPLGDCLGAGTAEAVVRGLDVRDVESTLTMAGGHVLPVLVSASPLRGRDGSVSGAVSVAKDLTARKASEAAIRGAYSMLSATFEATADGILVVDQEGRILRHNQKFASMWRIPEEILASKDDGRALAHVLGQLKDPEAFLAKVKQLYGDAYGTSFDILEFRDGRVFERFSQPQVVNGVCVGRVWDFRDVSERRRLESMLSQSEKLSAVGQLAAGVAHEINNPLGVILGFAQAARRRLKPGDELELPVRSIEREAERCARLVKNLLTFSRQSQPHIEELDLNETALATLSLVETRAKVHGVEVRHELAATLKARGDRVQLQQVVLNLCNNAVDAVPAEGGRVVIRTRDDGAAGAVVLEVEDNGTGIPEDALGKIFNPFFTTKEVGKGTGLGLSLVHEIVERHGGSIAVRSRPGEGTLFTVTLPAGAP
jgi:PAS domain S-box-containing protein